MVLWCNVFWLNYGIMVYLFLEQWFLNDGAPCPKIMVYRFLAKIWYYGIPFFG